MKNLTKLAIATSLLAASSATFAASVDGPVGATSTATQDVTLTISEAVEITDIDDIAIPSWTAGDGDTSAFDDVCVYNNGDGLYNVTITDNTVASAGFGLTDTATSLVDLPMTVTFNDEALVGGGLVTHGTPLIGQTNADTSRTCANDGGTNARVHVDVLGTDLDTVITGTYLSILTIIIAPE